MRRGPDRQGGYGLLLLLLALGLGVLVMLTQSSESLSPSPSNSVNRVSIKTADALQQAKWALLGYAATYPDTHAYTFGYLPTPDMGSTRNTPGTTPEGQTGANFTGNGLDMSVVGRLPWNTLGLPPLKDEFGECLWYAVSGSHQQAQKSALQTMNWDAVSYLDANSPDGASSLSGGNAHNRVVAVVFSAGPPLSGQNRAANGADNVAICGGNYDAANYLDANAGLTNYFPDPAANHATGTGAPPPTAPKQLLSSPLAGGTQTLNDRAVFITADDVFRVVRQRSDFIQNGTYGINAITTCLTPYRPNYPAPETIKASNSSYKTGTLPTACKGYAPTAYASHFFYIACIGSNSCLNAYTPGNNPCKAVVIFGGARAAGQTRITAAQIADPVNYLEGQNYTAYATAVGTALSGNPTFLPADPTTDVIQCLN